MAEVYHLASCRFCGNAVMLRADGYVDSGRLAALAEIKITKKVSVILAISCQRRECMVELLRIARE